MTPNYVVVYVDHVPDRKAALKTISAELAAMQAALKAKGYRAALPANTQGDEVKLVVDNGTTQVRVEVNFVFRGSVLPVETRSLVVTAQDLHHGNRASGACHGRALWQQARSRHGSPASPRRL